MLGVAQTTNASHAGKDLYDSGFFDAQVSGSLRSAEVVVPLVVELLQPDSVIDVGCGRGAWLSVFGRHGVPRIAGLDGDWVDIGSLLIPKESFHRADLAKPLDLRERFDLAVSLEVAEHLPITAAADFVASLCMLAPLVLFSAAIPMQGGTGHLNEQWHDYWQSNFQRHGFRKLDAIRPLIWRDSRVDWWYRQNILLFARNEIAAEPRFTAIAAQSDDLELVHRRVLRDHLLPAESIRGTAARLLWLLRRKLTGTRGRT